MNNPGLQVCLFANIQSARQAHLYCSFCTSITSSPRRWGIFPFITPHSLTHRFIPTHVGHILINLRRVKLIPVHPHACGAYSSHLLLPAFHRGSSPRMWGICKSSSRHLQHPRFIPTHVGHMPCGTHGWSRSAVHPHACGAYVAIVYLFPCAVRFIPTHVGHMV